MAPLGRSTPVPRSTRDALLSGAVELWQPAEGYRVNQDSLLLIAFAEPRRVDVAVDLGAGVGALGLLAARRGLAGRVVLVEADPKSAALASENLVQAGVAGAVLELDLRRDRLPAELHGVGLVLCNPPYYTPSAHRASADPERAAARHGEVLPFLRAAARLLARKTGRALFCYPASSLPELLAEAEAVKLRPKRLRFVHAYADKPARLALIELRVARPHGLTIEPPLIEWVERGVRSAELAAITAGRADDRT